MDGNPFQSPTHSGDHSEAANAGRMKGSFFATLTIGVAVQLALLAITLLVLDGGVLCRQYMVGMIGYWLGVFAIGVRRRRAPT